MWRYLLIAGLLALADARVMRSKRSTYAPLDQVTLAGFTNQFRQMLLHLIGAEYNATEPLVKQLKIDMATCKAIIGVRQGQCTSCAKGKCKPGLDDIILHYLEKGAEPFVDFGNDFVGWKGWDDMGNWFEGIGHEFTGWGGWNDVGDFFEGIGDWNGWDIAGDFAKDFVDVFADFGKGIDDFFGRRKRALDRKMPARELVTLYRALGKMYARADEIDPEVRECMEQCSECSPFLKATSDETVNEICGPELLKLNQTVFIKMAMLQTQYEKVMDTDNLIVRGVRYDVSSMDVSDPLNIKFTVALLDAMCSDGYTEYQSAEGYLISKPHVSAALMAKEYFDRNC